MGPCNERAILPTTVDERWEESRQEALALKSLAGPEWTFERHWAADPEYGDVLEGHLWVDHHLTYVRSVGRGSENSTLSLTLCICSSTC